MKSIVLIILVTLIILAIINRKTVKSALGKLGVRANGHIETMANNSAMTVEGARDYFNDAIQKKQDLLAEAESTFQTIAGKVSLREKERHDLQKELIGISQQIDACLDKNDEEGAKAWASKKASANHKIEAINSTLGELIKSRDQQDANRKAIEYELNKLKEEMEVTLFQLEADQEIISLHQGLNTSASSNESDKMLNKVREGARKTREMATGAQIAYDTSSTAQDRALEQTARDREAEEILAAAKARRNQ